MRTLLTYLIVSLLALAAQGQSRALYPLKKGDRWGYINEKGKERIPAIYRGITSFSEGLAAVRANGTYGYIDTAGTMVVPARFDYAERFELGNAIAYVNGKPYLIDRKGNTLFDHRFTEISNSGHDRLWIVRGQRGRSFGLINQSGQLILDTVYSRIEPFRFGKAVVYRGYSTREAEDGKQDAGIVNTRGVFVLPFGRFASLISVRDGHFVGSYKTRGYKSDWRNFRLRDVLLDENGKPMFSIESKEWFMEPEDFSRDVSSIYIQAFRKFGGRYHPVLFAGIVDYTGHIVHSDSSWNVMTSFSNKRAFVKFQNFVNRGIHDRWILIDDSGSQVGNSIFSDVYLDKTVKNFGTEEAFSNGIAFVAMENGNWTAIDTDGRAPFAPLDLKRLGSKDAEVSGRVGDVLILKEDIGTKQPADYRYGFWDPRRQVYVRPQYYDLSMNATGLIRVITDDLKLAYLNRQGGIIWKEAIIKPVKKPLHIDYMIRGYFYADGPDRQDLAGYGGWGHSGNESKTFQSQVPFKKNDLALFIIGNDATWQNSFKGSKVYLSNATHDTMYFPAQDSRLYMNVQAQDPAGIWRDIEYLPNSWCSNSYHTLALNPKQYWDFVMPAYEGSMRTKLRIKLEYRTTSRLYEGNSNEVLYSNEVDGSINPAQFWRQLEYYPNGLMDLYND